MTALSVIEVRMYLLVEERNLTRLLKQEVPTLVSEHCVVAVLGLEFDA
jgi:hypothetical protein